MRFGWTRGSAEVAATRDDRDDRDEATPFELAAVDITTLGGRHLGWIATEGERTSDWLNQNERVTIHGLTEVPLAEALAEPSLPGREAPARHELDRGEIVFLVPPPLPPNRHLRLHRRRVRIHLDVGSYRISGQLHVRPGAEAGDYALRSSRSMIPLTEVELVHEAEPEFRSQLAVLIVNTRHVTRMREAESDRALAAAPRPQPRTEPAPPQVSPTQHPRLMAALQLLLDNGLITVDEFQLKRGALLAARPQASS